MKPLAIVAVILGILFIIVAIIYFITPASSLPGFFPGQQAGMTTHHYKHGIGSFLLGVACFVFAWFQIGKKKTSVKEEKQAE